MRYCYIREQGLKSVQVVRKVVSRRTCVFFIFMATTPGWRTDITFKN